jgi:hypothetical protein
VLSRSWTACRSAAVCAERSPPLKKYCRSTPLVFSLLPRSHGLAG